jgi:hypothetical protein
MPVIPTILNAQKDKTAFRQKGRRCNYSPTTSLMLNYKATTSLLPEDAPS